MVFFFPLRHTPKIRLRHFDHPGNSLEEVQHNDFSSLQMKIPGISLRAPKDLAHLPLRRHQ
jgi:hypothetical protein